MGRLQRHLWSALAMIAGATLVFGFILAMNSYTSPPVAKSKTADTSFDVKPPPKRKQRQVKPKPKPKKTAQAKAPPAPTPVLAGGLASVSLDLPGFDSSSLGAGADDLLGSAQKDMVMDEGSVDEPPRAISRVAPSEYPPAARKQGITGYVKMNLLIGTGGDVERVKVLEASPPGVFDQVALETIRRWRFEPAVYQAEHVRVWATQTIRFALD